MTNFAQAPPVYEQRLGGCETEWLILPQPKRSLDIIVQKCTISSRSDITAYGDIIALHKEGAISIRVT